MRKNFIKATSLVWVLALLTALATTALAAPPEQTNSDKSIVDIAIEDGQFTTLVAALKQAGLVDRLQGEGPFTVFAPTDEAFAKLPEGAIEDLFADKQALTEVLLYHVVDGQLRAADVTQQEAFAALTGQALTITTEGETVMINGAKVLTTDLAGANGIIHVIDTVLMPPAGEIVTADTLPNDAVTTPGQTTPGQTPLTAGCAEDYVVQASDSLSQIADKYLGDPLAFSQIVEATNTAAADNQTYLAIDNPDLIEVGQTVCIPASPQAQATTTEEETMTPALVADKMTDVPEGKAKVVFENFSFVDLVFDLSGPTADSMVVVPNGKQEFILEPGLYNYNAHQPGGDFSVAPGSFELKAGQGVMLNCSDAKLCSMQEVDPKEIPTTETGQP